MTITDVKDMFTLHPANTDKNAKFERIRKAGEDLAVAILEVSPPGTNQQDAINHILHGVWSANHAIARAKS